MPSSPDYFKKAPPDRGVSSFIYPPTDNNLDFFAQALQSGCLVAIPTETVYGLAGLALDERACRSIFEVKGRPLVDPLIVHVSSREMAFKLADLNDTFDKLEEHFWPGPLTLVLNKKTIVPDLVTAGKNTVALRMPNHPVPLKLMEILGSPIAAPSANPFGYISPSRAAHVAESFGDRVPFIIDGGTCRVGLESTILDISRKDQPQILRPGAISADQISKVLNTPVSVKRVNTAKNRAAAAPGTFVSHYSPKTDLHLFPEGEMPIVRENETAVFLRRREYLQIQENTYWLSEDGSMEEVAKTLYDLLRNIDRKNYALIHCECPKDTADGYAVAIRDRLSRAAAAQ